ncbi:MAG: S8 family serine peptidase [Oscillospiraceae bacterium]|nr:S8 family serine peptidase [Oscillospiraceae bacterium]
MKQRILARILVAACILLMVPTTALAAEYTPEVISNQFVQDEDSGVVVTSGDTEAALSGSESEDSTSQNPDALEPQAPAQNETETDDEAQESEHTEQDSAEEAAADSEESDSGAAPELDAAVSADSAEPKTDTTADASDDDSEFVLGTVIAGFDYTGTITKELLEEEFGIGYKVTEIKDLFEGIDIDEQILSITLEEETRQAVVDAISNLLENSCVTFAEPDYIISIPMDETIVEGPIQSAAAANSVAAGTAAVSAAAGTVTPNTPDDPDYNEQYGLQMINAPAAWNTVTGSHTVRVGVLDSGIDYTHPDLAGNIDMSAGTNVFYEDGDLMDDLGHGTPVAGVIGACGNNGIGVTGVCWDVSIVPIKVLSKNNTSSSGNIANGINYATRLQLPIINISLQNAPDSLALRNALKAYPGLVVTSAGNNGANVDKSSGDYYPGKYDYDNIINVANSTDEDVLASDSVYGAISVDIAAPGTGIYSTDVPNTYAYVSGTSIGGALCNWHGCIIALLRSYVDYS